MYTSNTSMLRPEAYITVRKSRLKLYGEKNYYLKDKTNFEIELFNPTNETVLAKIWINGVLISPSGLVIKSGMRSYLERFIDTPEKFQFNVFEVDDVKETKRAREKNGLVKVCFYKEINNQPININPNYFGGIRTYTTKEVPYTYTSNGFIGDTRSVKKLLRSEGLGYNEFGQEFNGPITTANAFYCSTSGMGTVANCLTTMDSYSAAPETVETGRIAAGPKSKQEFTYTSGTYSDFASHTYEYQLLPESLKAVIADEIRHYCHDCGTRVKSSSWRHCPTCGAAL